MCGIYGWQLPDSVSKEKRAVLGAVLGMLNDSRGGDSWGMYFVTDKPYILRGLGKSGPQFGWSDVAPSIRFVMGHTRKATVGGISVENAHPFEIGNIVGAHNGGVSNHSELNKQYGRNFEVDSMHIFAHIQKGWKLDELRGWGAIEYTNQKKWPGRVNLCRFSGGSLSVCGIGKDPNDYNGVVWSSDADHLRTALETAGFRKGESYFEFESVFDQVYFVEDCKYMIKVGKKLSLGWGGSYGGNYSHYSDSDYSVPYVARKSVTKSKAADDGDDNGWKEIRVDGVDVWIDTDAVREFIAPMSRQRPILLQPPLGDPNDITQEVEPVVIPTVAEVKADEIEHLEVIGAELKEPDVDDGKAASDAIVDDLDKDHGSRGAEAEHFAVVAQTIDSDYVHE
jgi:hypothetical protein